MDIKAFVLGALSGIAGCILAYQLTDRGEQRSVSLVSPRQAVVSEADSQQASDPPLQRAATQASVPTPVGESRDSQADAERTAEPSEEHDAALSPRAGASFDTRAAQSKEPKDPAWAHYMEETLRRYLASHPKAPQFDIRNIDCRTTFCEVQVFGFDESTEPVWQQVMYDIRQQPWSEFFQYGSASGPRDGRYLMVGTFARKPSN